MGSNSRYDHARPVGDREAAEARALHLIGELVGDYPGISDPDVAAQVSHVLHATAIELISRGFTHVCGLEARHARGYPA